MSTATTRLGPRQGGTLRWLADAYARYAHLVLGQLEALEEGDVARVESLAQERDALAVEIDEAEPAEAFTTAGADRVVADIRLALTRAAEADAKLRTRLGQLRTETRAAISETEHAADRVAGIARSYAPPAPPGGRLDVSL